MEQKITDSEKLAWLIRRHGIEMTHKSGGAHIGSVLSVADIIAVLYADVMRYDSGDPNWKGRDKLILSKGHAGAALYAVLAEEGFFNKDKLMSHYANGSRLTGHVNHKMPGIEFSTGSLGHGLSVALGMAFAAKKMGKKNQVYCVVGDGECNEGSIWEAAMFANHFCVNNLIVIVDYNQMQSLDFVENTMDPYDFAMKWRAFGWNVAEVDGNDHIELKAAFRHLKKFSKEESHKPSVIIAKTIKGYGIPFMENNILWHYRYPHDGWEYDCSINALHQNKPAGVKDPYTPDGIKNPKLPDNMIDISCDYTMSSTWNPKNREGLKRREYHPKYITMMIDDKKGEKR